MLVGVCALNKIVHFEKFVESNNYGYWNGLPLQGYIYYDLFEHDFCVTLKKHVENIIKYSSKNTFYTQNIKFNFNNSQKTLISNKPSDREQNVIHDLLFLPNYAYQTAATIKTFAEENISQHVSPIFQKCFRIIENLFPICENKDDYVIYRCHINYIPYQKHLSLHTDATPIMFKGNAFNARTQSLTFYLYDHVPNLGGELWSVNGFVYKPKFNSAILINGHQVLHGVTYNMNKDPRLAFTVRLAHKDDLYLPGDPSKFLYDMSDLTV